MPDARIVVDVKFEEICGTYQIAAENGPHKIIKTFAVKPRLFWEEIRPPNVETVIYDAVMEVWQAAKSAVEIKWQTK